MIGLDSNVLVRYLVQDDRGQAARAARCIEAADARCYIGVVVLCEVVWVLESVYGFDKATVTDTLEKIVMTAQFEIEDKDLVLRALSDFRNSRADFADCLTGRRNRAAGCTETVTFDKPLKALDGFRLL